MHSSFARILTCHALSLVPFMATAVMLCVSAGKSNAVPPRILSFTVDDAQLPLDGSPWLSWETVGADTISLSPGIGDVTSFTDADGAGNGVPPAPVSVFRFVDLNEDWLFLDDGSDISGEGWQLEDYDDADWGIGQAPLGYGDPAATALEFGGDPANKVITYYFRKSFETTQARIDDAEVLYLELQRDDGAIVYLNGVEILRDNLPEDSVDGTTLTTFATAGAAETQIFRYIIEKELLRDGTNILSAEVHQVSSTSSDLIFDAGIYSVRATAPLSAVEFNSVWRYLDDGTDLAGTPWNSSDFDDSDWSEGAGEFGYDSTVEATMLSFGDDPSNKHITYYFRRKFLVGDSASIRGLIVNLLYDDGAIIYLNGVEAGRVNLPDGTVSADTPALFPSTERVYEEIDLTDARDFLLNGENTLAVEIHQADPTSSDVSFDLDLISTDANVDDATLIERRALWIYDDTGVDRGPSDQDPDFAWFGPQFDDSGWNAGPAELGYGDSDGSTFFATSIQFGPDPENKPITTYFRRTFDIDADTHAQVDSWTLTLQRDDGAIVYLNGEEIVRDNLEEGEVDGFTPALSAVGAAATTNWTIERSKIAVGTNTLAVEVHQQDSASSDLFFDLRLIGTHSAAGMSYKLTATNSDGSTSAEVMVDYVPVIDGSPLPLDPIFLTTSHPTGADWEFPAMWSSRQRPVAGQNYIVHGNFASTIRSPAGVIDPDFQGNLTLAGVRSRLILGHANGSTARIPLLTIRNGSVWQSLDNAYQQIGVAGSVIVVEESATFAHASASGERLLAIGSDLQGTGTITVSGPDIVGGSTATLFLGDGSAFTGDWMIEDTVSAAGRNALGTGDITVDGTGALDFDYDYHNPDGTITLNGDTSQLVIDHTISVGTLIARGLNLPNGVYEGVAIEALGQNFVGRGGKLIIAGSNPDSDNDELLDEWEMGFFGSLVETGNGDFDGDGTTNAQEEVIGTDPTNRNDAFRLAITPNPSEDSASQVLTISWPGLSSRTYFVQISEDLINWRVVGLIPGTDGTTTFEDGSNFPPGSNDAPLYYRVVVSGS